MDQHIIVAVKSLNKQTALLELHPLMKMKELTQILLSSKLLHQSQAEKSSLIPIGILSINKNILIDYMLKTKSYTLEEVYLANRYAEIKEMQQNYHLKQTQYKKRDQPEGRRIIHIAINYKNVENISNEGNQALEYCYKEEHLGYNSILEDQNQKGELSQENYFHFTSTICLDRQSSNLMIHKSVNKSQLNSFQKVQKSIELKEKLIEQSRKHFCIHSFFLHFKQIIQQQDQITFTFNYYPNISVPEIVRFQSSAETTNFFIKKIERFLLYLMQNNFANYIYKLYKSKSLRLLFSKLRYCITGSVYIMDLNLLFEQGGGSTFTKKQQQELFQELRIYVNLNKAQLHKYQERVDVPVGRIMPSYMFSKVHSRKKYEFFTIQKIKYQPKTDIFTWKQTIVANPEQEKKKKYINEVTTAKKPQKNIKMHSEKKTKVNREITPQRWNARESIKKSKCKKQA